MDAKAAFHEAANGNFDAERALDDAAKSLAVLVINICRVVDPDMVVFGGGMSQAGDKLLHRIRSHMKKLSWSVLPTFVKLGIAKSSVNAGLIGAALAGKHDRAVSPSGGDDRVTLHSLIMRADGFAACLAAAAGVGSVLTWWFLVRARR
jgi:N-acetylglucosamine kinase-like BadF-type ATPase